MTSANQYNNDRLERIEALVEENSRAIAENNQAIAQQRQSIEQLATVAQAALSLAQSNRESIQQTEQLTKRNATAIARLEERMEQYIIEGREHREFIATQVDGIKLETRRIIQHLFGEIDNE
ncbi:hypothetical protein NIES4102_37440 [Chondrocystis sp. NIES-4102]|nr:hypothetical protein NIES4102_37440 [Chondrocystis sp. NIES-4102]